MGTILRRSLLFVSLLVLLVVAFAPLAHGLPAFVQSKSAFNATASTSCVFTYTNAVVAGNTLQVGAMWNSSTATASISSSPANTWSTDIGPITHGTAARRVQVWHADNVASGSTAITVTFSASVTNACAGHESSGLATSASFDQSSSGTGTDNSPNSGATPTTTVANEYLFGFAAGGTDSAPWTAGTNYTLRESSTNPNPGYASEDQIVSATGAYTATFTSSGAGGTSWIAIITTYKAASGAPPSQLPLVGVGTLSFNWPNIFMLNGCAIGDSACSFVYEVCDASGGCLRIPEGSSSLSIFSVRTVASYVVRSPLGSVAMTVKRQ